ncbi:MAG TPA: homoserine kinase [Micromonosporaceae bacterium]|nr:homoserine kinase [Micromonosporaceae bacterium]
MPVPFLSTSVQVRAPATCANLGPGFDALGLALCLHDEVMAKVTPAEVRVTIRGEGAGELPLDGTHLVVRAMYATFDELGAGRPPGLAVDCHNRIPQARGLGSSSAAIVSGVLLARALVAGGGDRLDDVGVLRLAARLEGHPDNVAACLFGGFTIAWTAAAGACAVSRAPAATVAPTVFVSPARGLTAAARAALPAAVPYADAVWTVARTALLVHALSEEPGLLFEATGDRLHQPYRAVAAPETAALVERLRAAGVAAVVSGAGPSVLALTEVPSGFAVDASWRVLSVAVDPAGASGILRHAERDPVAAGWAS